MNKKFGLLLVVGILFLSEQSFALTTLSHVEVDKSNHVELLFNKKVTKDQVQIEYIRDIIQISIQDVSVYPAKVLSVNGEDLKKVFAYQYLPDLIRTRLTVAGRALDYKNRIELDYNGRMMGIKLLPSRKNPITTPAAQIKDKVSLPSSKNIGEKELLQKILNEKPEKKVPLTDGDRQLPNPLASLFWLGVLMTVLGIVSYVARRRRQKKKSKRSGFFSVWKDILGRFSRRSMSGSEKMIEVISTQYIGPKQSIAVIRVKGNEMVVGITNETISKISDLDQSLNPSQSIPSQGSVEKAPQRGKITAYLEKEMAKEEFQRDFGDEFNRILEEDEGLEPSLGSGAVSAGPPVFRSAASTEKASKERLTETSVRDRIRQKVGDLKHL